MASEPIDLDELERIAPRFWPFGSAGAIIAEVRKLRAGQEQLTTIVDEALGPFPVISGEELLTELERGLFRLRAEGSTLRAERERVRAKCERMLCGLKDTENDDPGSADTLRAILETFDGFDRATFYDEPSAQRLSTLLQRPPWRDEMQALTTDLRAAINAMGELGAELAEAAMAYRAMARGAGIKEDLATGLRLTRAITHVLSPSLGPIPETPPDLA